MNGLIADLAVDRGDLTIEAALQVNRGDVLALVGPNGAGKSSILQALAGLLSISRGAISINNQIVDSPEQSVFVPPRLRNIGMLFQDYAIFPHLNVRSNIAFGLKSRGFSGSEANKRVDELLSAYGLEELANRKPRELSGGQAQRVALARALASEPDLFLLDEPLAALDVVTTGHVRNELKNHLASFEGVTIVVTHDPLDALLLADHIAILEEGRVTQTGTPSEISRHPRTDYAATLVGVTLVSGIAHSGILTTSSGARVATDNQSLDGPAAAIIRPDSVVIHLTRPEGSSRNVWPGVVSGIEQSTDRVRISVSGEFDLVATITPNSLVSLGLSVGTSVWTSVKAVEVSGINLS